MGRRAGDGLQRGELAGDERRELLERRRLHHHHQVVGAAHEVEAGDLLELVDARGDGVEAPVALGLHAHLDHRLHHFLVGALPVDHGRVFDEHAVVLQALYGATNLLRVVAGHHGDLLRADARVVGEDFEDVHFKRIIQWVSPFPC